jgi:hypothetical protein
MNDKTAINIDSSSIEFRLNTRLKPWNADDPEAYSQEIVGRIVTYTEQDQEVSLGKIRMLLPNLSEAIHDEAELAFIFDAVSLDNLWAALFAGGDFDPDVAVQFRGKGIHFLDRVNVEPDYEGTTLRARAIQTAITILCPTGMAVSHCDLLTDSAWQALGFRRLPGTEFVYKEITSRPNGRSERAVNHRQHWE